MGTSFNPAESDAGRHLGTYQGVLTTLPPSRRVVRWLNLRVGLELLSYLLDRARVGGRPIVSVEALPYDGRGTHLPRSMRQYCR
jgi:hypothetical protein